MKDRNKYAKRLVSFIMVMTIVLSSFLAIGVLAPSKVSAWGNDGLTPGWWKNHTDMWDTDTGYTCGWYYPWWTVNELFDDPEQTTPSMASVLGGLGLSDLGDDTLVEALSYHGGKGIEGAARILLRAAVAAMLNGVTCAGPEYPSVPWEIAPEVKTALASGDRDTMLSLAEQYDIWNNLGFNG